MSSEAINIVLNLSPDGAILSFSVQTTDECKELSEVKSDSKCPELCPICTCRISVFARPLAQELKTEVLSEKEDSPEDSLDPFDGNAASSDDDEKPLVELFVSTMDVKPDATTDPKHPKLKRRKKRSSDKVAPLRCLHCNHIFRNSTRIYLHQQRFGIKGSQTEAVPDAVKCLKHCRRYFSNNDELQKHLKELKKKNNSYKCDKCPEVFTVWKTYRTHLLTHGPITCHKCPLKFTDSKSYNKHLTTHVKISDNHCPTCHHGLESGEALSIHIRWFHENNRACTYCGQTFTRWLSLRDHENQHNNILPFQCHLCGASFARNAALSRHLENHQGRVYICNFCGKSYKWKPYLKHHIFSRHMEPQMIFECTRCPNPKSFTTLLEYRSHVKRHDIERNVPCPNCAKLFRSDADVKKHVDAVHTDLRQREKFECETCGKFLFTKYSLQSHLNLHKSVTEFRCRYCPKMATNLHNLQRHEMIHTDERPFTCQTCGKSFRHSDGLKTHIRLHTGEKPYECPVEECKKRFSDRGCFRSHLLVHEKQMNVKLIKKKRDINDF